MKDLKAALDAYLLQFTKSYGQLPTPAEIWVTAAAWQRERDIEIAFGLCDNDKGHEVADEIRAQAFDEPKDKA